MALKLVTFFAILATAAVVDVRRKLIPNRLTGTALILGIGFGVLQGSLGAALAGAVLAFAVTLPLFVLRAIGGGDAKLLMAIGAFMGPVGLVNAAVYAGIAGGLLALAEIVRRGKILPVLKRAWDLILFCITLGHFGARGQLGDTDTVTIPYGLALAAGALVAWFIPILDGGLP